MAIDTSDEILRTRLLAAYQADAAKSKMGRLRKQYDTIVALKKGGMSLGKILDVLNQDGEAGLGLTMKTFNGYMHLLRKERQAEKAAATVQIGKTTGDGTPAMRDRRATKPAAEEKSVGKSPATAKGNTAKSEGSGQKSDSASNNTLEEMRSILQGNAVSAADFD